jgi:hypothetical protein
VSAHPLTEPPIAVSVARLRKVWRIAGYDTSEWVPFGLMGLQLSVRYPLRLATDHRPYEKQGTIIVSQGVPPAEVDPEKRAWLHASLSWWDEIPSYEDLALLHESVFGKARNSYQVFSAADRHVNFHPNALHLWGLVSGDRVLPDFGRYGMV